MALIRIITGSFLSYLFWWLGTILLSRFPVLQVIKVTIATNTDSFTLPLSLILVVLLSVNLGFLVSGLVSGQRK